MKDFSQDREQGALFAALGGEDAIRATPQTVIEIGSWHFETFSNSRALIKCGWKAVLIEPSPAPMLGLLDAYGNNPNVTLINAAVSLEENLIPMHITDDAVSTSESSVYEQWKGTAKYRGKMWVPTISLERLFRQFGGAAVVSIDAEGISVDLFNHMVALHMYPDIVIVEYDNRMPELCAHATKHGYKLIYSNGTNAVMHRYE